MSHRNDSECRHSSYACQRPHKLVAQVNTPYPTAILVREKAMVINLESIRMIICKDQVRSLTLRRLPRPALQSTR